MIPDIKTKIPNKGLLSTNLSCRGGRTLKSLDGGISRQIGLFK